MTVKELREQLEDVDENKDVMVYVKGGLSGLYDLNEAKKQFTDAVVIETIPLKEGEND